jgi:hypothetical protein
MARFSCAFEKKKHKLMVTAFYFQMCARWDKQGKIARTKW